MSKQMAIIKEVSFGLRDVGKVNLSFSTYISECEAALQVLFRDEYEKLIMDGGIKDIKELDGKPCWVEVTGNLIDFIEFCKIK